MGRKTQVSARATRPALRKWPALSTSALATRSTTLPMWPGARGCSPASSTRSTTTSRGDRPPPLPGGGRAEPPVRVRLGHGLVLRLVIGLHPDEAVREVVESAKVRPVLVVPSLQLLGPHPQAGHQGDGGGHLQVAGGKRHPLRNRHLFL